VSKITQRQVLGPNFGLLGKTTPHVGGNDLHAFQLMHEAQRNVADCPSSLSGGQHHHHAGQRPRRRVDRQEARMCVGTAPHNGMQHPWQPEVIDKRPLAGHQARVFKAF
jgi:hypothetical protein